ncbi:MAG: DNA-3-methyladenine glycosylase 2 [Chloroflexi bacterium]|nr:DNA-3-methyladenine glycosylase 2 [Chloroflexota bacterium]
MACGSSGMMGTGTSQQMFFPVSEFDLSGTIDGGQAFRWHAVEDGKAYRGVVGGSVLEVRSASGGLDVTVVAGDGADESRVRTYLGLDDDLEALRAKYADDPGLGPALSGYLGLRLLKQDPWECLCGFICSATSNIPRIKLNMGSMASTYGERIGPGEADFAFPGPEAVASAGEQAARDLAWGFRARYLEGAAVAVATGKFVLEGLLDMSYEEARDALVTLDGIGPKIADCVLAFSLRKGEAFPVDRWVRRAMEEWYGASEKMSNDAIGQMARDRFGDDAAYAQQYLFHRQRLAARAAG